MGTEDPEDRLARTQAYAALVVAILVLATVAVALALDRPDTQVDRSTWAYEMVQLEQANGLGWTGLGVIVGVVDTGVDMDHPTMRGVELVAWSDLVNGRETPYDDLGHGTAMASIILGRSPLRGGAPDARLVAVKVVDGDDQLAGDFDQALADGIDFCLDNGADVVSLSLGGDYESIDLLVGPATQAAISQAVATGAVVVAAAGNDGASQDVSFPGRFTEVVSVGAVDKRGQLAPFSSRGNVSVERPDPHKKPEVVAPGVDVNTAHLGDNYAKGSGTSHSTAMVSAVLAVALSHNADLQRGGERGGNETVTMAIKTALVATARPLEGQVTPHDPKAGYGLVQAVDLAMELEGM